MSRSPFKVTAILDTVNSSGRITLPYASVSIVYKAGGAALVYDEQTGGASIDNPYLLNANGEREVWLEPAEYMVSVAGGEFYNVQITEPSERITAETSPDPAGVLDLSANGVEIWRVLIDRDITSVILPVNLIVGTSLNLTIVFEQPEGGGFEVLPTAWQEEFDWEFGLTPIYDTTSFGKTTIELLITEGRNPLGVSGR